MTKYRKYFDTSHVVGYQNRGRERRGKKGERNRRERKEEREEEREDWVEEVGREEETTSQRQSAILISIHSFLPQTFITCFPGTKDTQNLPHLHSMLHPGGLQ